MKPDFAYFKTLDYFLKRSNADEVGICSFLRTFPSFCAQLKEKLESGEPISWLEVGPGPGTKSLEIARALIRRYKVKIEFVSLEPCRDWIPVYKENIEQLGLNARELTAKNYCAYVGTFRAAKRTHF